MRFDLGEQRGWGGGGTAGDGGGTGRDGGGTAGDGGGTELDFRPFVDSTLYPVARIGDIAEATGVLRYTLGFLVAQGPSDCTPSWGGYHGLEAGPDSWGESGQYFLYDEIDRVRAAGGDAVVSLGGASCTPLAAACDSADELVDQLRAIVDRLELAAIDFDIEGAWLAHDESVTRRNAAIAALQGELAARPRWSDGRVRDRSRHQPA